MNTNQRNPMQSGNIVNIEDDDPYPQLKIVTTGSLAPQRDGDELFLAVAAPTVEDLSGPNAKNLAYDARHDYGFANAGIERYESIVPLTSKGEPTTRKLKKGELYAQYAAVFRLTLGI